MNVQVALVIFGLGFDYLGPGADALEKIYS